MKLRSSDQALYYLLLALKPSRKYRYIKAYPLLPTP